MGIPTPDQFEEAVAAVFSGSRFMRFMMPPLLGLSSLFCFLAALAGFTGEDGIVWILALGGLSWGIILLFSAYASLRPHGTGWIQGIFALHLAVWVAFWAFLLFSSDSKEFSSWIGCLFLIIFAFGAASYGVSCFRHCGNSDPADASQDSPPRGLE
ncbi:MAG: hypothetical protein ACR2RV_15870 [Verrucomicrobiales bacterium]